MKVGLIGWRGMVGSVLMDRMRAEGDFDHIDAVYFSTSQVGQDGPDGAPLADAFDVDAFDGLQAVITCQGGDYTKKMHSELRAGGWKGFWIDAASALRMDDDATIILDPVNRDVIDAALDADRLDFIGGNCTVSLMLMATVGLFSRGWVEWVSAMTYQSSSGAGARNMKELVTQMADLGDLGRERAADPRSPVLELDHDITARLRDDAFPTSEFGAPLAASLIPWIDSAVEDGQTREEWKGMSETNKILQSDPVIPVDGICVRVPAMRCHSQALTMKLKQDIPLDEIESALAGAHEWVSFVPNEKEATLAGLTPAAVSGSLVVPVGRVHKLKLGPEYLGLFTVGDQLLWGAAEPLRRMLRILCERHA